MADRVAAQGVPPLAHDDGADLGERPLPADRLPGDLVLLGAQAEEGRAEEPRRGRPEAARDLREARACRCTSARRSPASRSTPSSTASRSRPPSRRSCGRPASSSARSPRRSASTPSSSRKYLGSVVPLTDNFFATLNSAVFSDGSFVYVPKGVRCPMELSTYFRINAAKTGQFERTLIVAERGRLRELPRGLHGADARREPAPRGGRRARRASRTRRSSTRRCRTGTRATRTARAGSTTSSPSAASARGARSRISWTQVETGSAITWKYPCLHPAGRRVGGRVLLGRGRRTTTSRPTPAPR